MKRLLVLSITALALVALIGASAFAAANKVTGVSVGSQSGTATQGVAGTVDFLVSLTCSAGSSAGASTVSVNNLPTGASVSWITGTYTVSGASVTLPISSASGNVTLRISTGTASQGTYNTLTVTATSSPNVTSGAFTYTVDAPLPVQLVSFNAAPLANGAQLEWSTATEVGSASFEVERRSLNGGSWMTVGSVAAAGTSFSPKDYVYVDESVSPGSYAYRLKQIDRDGSFSYFGAAEVSVGLAPQEFALVQNYPNPFNPSTTISFSVPENGRATLKVLNILGQEVATLFDRAAEAGVQQRATFDASNLPSGMYFARLEFGKQASVKRMLLVK